MSTDSMAVLGDGLFFEEASQIWKGKKELRRWPEDLREGADLLEELFASGVESFVLHGGDELVSAVVTAYWRRRSLGAYPLEFWPLEMGSGFVAAEGKGDVSARRARAMIERPARQWARRSVSTLRVVSSLEPGAWYGFSFGAGWVYRALEARKRARGGAANLVSAAGKLAMDTFQSEEEKSLAERVAINYSPRKGGEGSLLATTLSRSYFGITTTGAEARYWDRLGTSGLLRRVVTPDLLERVGGGESFEVIHLDGPGGWALDGRLFQEPEPSVLEISPGPAVTLLSPPRGIGARLGRVFG